MPRAIVATRSARRRIPSSADWDLAHWNWEPVVKERRRSRRVAGWMLFALGAIVVLVAVQVFGSRHTVPQVKDDILWMEETPVPVTPPATTESVVPERFEPSSPQAVQAAPVPLEVAPAPAANTSEPVFGMDDAGPTGDLAVATGTTLAGPSQETVRDPEPAAGALLLESVPASTKPVVPRYPPAAEALGKEGSVVALVTTDTAGNVVGFRIEKSGGRDFDESVRRAALSTRFRVPVREGRPRAVAFRMPYSFRLE